MPGRKECISELSCYDWQPLRSKPMSVGCASNFQVIAVNVAHGEDTSRTAAFRHVCGRPRERP